MAHQMYEYGVYGFITGEIDWDTDSFYVALIDTAVYTVALDSDRYLDDVLAPGFGAGVIATSDILTGTIMGTGVNRGRCYADSTTFTGVTGADGGALVVYKDTGSSATSPLVCYIENATGLPVTPSGGDIQIDWPDSVVFTARATTPYMDLVVAAGPLGYWPLGETTGDMIDQVGSVNLTVNSGTRGVTGLDELGLGYAADGSSGWLDGSAVTVLGGITQEAWINIAAAPGINDATIITLEGLSYLWMKADRTLTGYDFRTGNGARSAASSAAVDTGVWTHIVAAADTSGGTYYIDGVASGTFTPGGSGLWSTGGTSNVVIGRESGGGRPWTGYIQHVAIYGYKLSSDQVINHYLAGVG